MAKNTDMNMKSIGQILKETREDRNLSIKEVSNAIKIRESLIEALENGEYFIFSSDMHLKSFLRSYARFLDINEEKAMALYRRDRQILSEENSSKSQNKNSGTFRLSKLFNLKTLFTLLAIISLGIGFTFFYKQYRAFTEPPRLEILNPAPNSVLSSENFVIEGFTGDPSIKVVVNGNEANYIDSLGKFRVSAKFTQEGINQFLIVARNEFPKETSVQLDLIYKKEKEVTKPKIRIKNISETTKKLEIKKDNNEVFEQIEINPNMTYDIEYTTKITVNNFSKTDLEIYFNNDANPTKSIDSNKFSVIMENDKPLIKIETNNEEETKPTI